MGFDFTSFADPVRAIAGGSFDPVSFVDPIGGDPLGLVGGNGKGYIVDTGSIFAKNGVNPSSSHKASELSAAITRQQFNDYQTRFSPYLTQLNSAVSDEAIKQRQTDMTDLINKQAAMQPQLTMQASQRNLSRYGAAQDPRAQGFGLRMANLDTAASASNQINQMSSDIKDTSMALLSGQKLTSGMKG